MTTKDAATERPSWECMGRKQSLPEPGECNWPDCGCDERATKVIESLLEQGWLGPQEVARLTSERDEARKEVERLAKAVDFMEWLIGFTGAARTHPLNEYANKILRDKVEQVGQAIGIFKPSATEATADRVGGSPVRGERSPAGGPYFSTQWEREDYERERRGEKPLGPNGGQR